MIAKERRRSGVYAIRNKVNGKVYVGSATSCLYSRWYVHKYGLRKGEHHSRHLQAAWNCYGASQFEFVVIEYCPSDNCLAREQYWIDHYKSACPEYGYNVNPNSTNSLGAKRTEETKRKLSEHIKKADNLQKLINASRTPEALLKRSQSLKGNCGKSDEHRAKLSEALMGRKVDREAVEKTASKLRGRKRPQEVRDKISATKKGVSIPSGKKGKKYGPDSAEVREKKAESARRAWANRKAMEETNREEHQLVLFK